jgi:hypothetical protein
MLVWVEGIRSVSQTNPAPRVMAAADAQHQARADRGEFAGFDAGKRLGSAPPVPIRSGGKLQQDEIGCVVLMQFSPHCEASALSMESTFGSDRVRG